MTYTGQIRHGVIVLDGNPQLRDGTIVRVEEVSGSNAGHRVGSPQAILEHAGAWVNVADDVDRVLADLHRMKQEEVRSQKETSDNGV